MSKSLGIYIEKNIIKYAKVSKERDNIKIEAYGVKVFENLTTEIKKIIEETYSFNTPISINLANEKYLYFDIFALLNKKDIERTVETEFEAYCEEKNYNRNALESRYALVQNINDKDKIKAINVMMNKIELNKQIQPFESFKLSKILPLPMIIPDICDLEKKENALIVNMEETATITTILDQKIYNVDVLEVGSKEVLEKINNLENSYSKAYEVCKNTTIYTADVETAEDDQPYLQYIIPVLYNIREELQRLIMNAPIKFDKVYLTGTLASVNNVDLYFQEVLATGECKILRPKFISENSTQINVKDYIEVNPAISLAVNDLREGNQPLNFKKTSVSEKVSNMMKIDVGRQTKNTKKGKKDKDSDWSSSKFSFDMKGNLERSEVWLIRGLVALIITIVVFASFSKILSDQMNAKEKQIKDSITSQNQEITVINGQNTSLKNKITKYQQLIRRLEEEDKRISEIAGRKNSIPNLLNQIMYIIPEEVQLTAIDNSIDKHIVIKAQAVEYDQLGYFIAKLKTKEILRNVVSSSGLKSGEIITVTIEGDLP